MNNFPGEHACFAAASAAGIGFKKKNCCGGWRKSLKKLDSAKELRHSNLDFVPQDLESVPSGLGFVPKNLDFVHPAGAPAFYQSSLMQTPDAQPGRLRLSRNREWNT